LNDIKQLAGVLNLDDPLMTLMESHHIDAKNGRFTGANGNMWFENIEGNSLIPNSFLPTTGINTTIGRHFDDVKNRVFFFNYNSLLGSAIYILNADESVSKLVSTDPSYADFLQFDPYEPITSIDILYNDEVDGDILYYIDSLKRPTQINIPRYLANTYTEIKRSFIDVIKAPPRMPIKCVYENDFTVTANQLLNAQFQFIYRYVYDNLEKSVWSTASILPLPYLSSDFSESKDNRFLNARIALFMQTGDADVKKIEIGMRQSSSGFISDWYLVDVLDKEKLSIQSNDIYEYKFYNNGTYNLIDKKEQLLDFDYVPDKANAGVLLNGNIPAYAGIVEGYDLVNGDMQNVSASSNLLYEINGLLFFGKQGYDDSFGDGDNLTLYLSGVGNNNLVNPILYNTRTKFKVRAIDASNVDISFEYDNISYNTLVSDIFDGLRIAALAQGFTLVSQTTTALTLSYAGYKLQSAYTEMDKIDLTIANTALTAVSSNQYYSSYQYGVVYRDEHGKTNGVVTEIFAKVFTVSDQDALDTYNPNIQLKIFNRPPSWAVDYSVVVSNNLTYDKEFYWISKGAYADAAGVDTRYAYIDISNIIDFNTELSLNLNQVTDGVVSYDFAKGDRVKFIKRYAYGGTETLLTAKQYDYEVIGVVNSLVANNTSLVGVFLKIKYPTADIGANFDFNGLDFQNYKVFIYSLQKSLSENKTTYYEIGHRRKIGNPNTNNAFHVGMIQDQDPTNLSIPAIEQIASGDKFLRYRNVPIGDTFKFQVQPNDQDSDTLLVIPVPNSPITTSKYVLRTQPDVGVGGGSPTISQVLYQNLTGASVLVKLKGSIPIVNDVEGCSFELRANVADFSTPTVIIPILSQSISQSALTYFDFNIDITVPSLKPYLFLSINPTSPVSFNALVVRAFELTVTVNNVKRLLQLIEKSQSDVYKLELNSYNKPNIIDENAKREFKSTLFRFANPREQGTNINQSNRFYPNNIDEFDRQWGEVVRMAVNGRQLEIFQYANTGVVGVYGKFIKDKSGTNNLITTDEIITPNNIQYYTGGYGIRNQPLALVKKGYAFYFPDVVLGVLCRLSENGVIAISEEFKIQTWAGENLPKYLSDSTYEFGGKAKIIAAYNQLKNRAGEFIFILQEGKNDGNVTKIASSKVFNEHRKAFVGDFEFYPDQIICAGNKLLTFYNGEIYKHTDTTTRTNFYGVQKYPSIKLVFNNMVALRKVYNAVQYISNKFWVSETNGDIITSELNDQTGLPMISSLKQGDYETRGNSKNAAFLMDANSGADPQIALLEGDSLAGNYIVIDFKYKGSDFASIFLPSVLSQEDKKNFKNP